MSKDKLVIEYMLKPVTKLSLDFMYRFTAPFETIWQDGSVSAHPVPDEEYDNSSISAEEAIKDFGMKEFRKMVANDGGFLSQVKNGVELKECKIVQIDT